MVANLFSRGAKPFGTIHHANQHLLSVDTSSTNTLFTPPTSPHSPLPLTNRSFFFHDPITVFLYLVCHRRAGSSISSPTSHTPIEFFQKLPRENSKRTIVPETTKGEAAYPLLPGEKGVTATLRGPLNLVIDRRTLLHLPRADHTPRLLLPTPLKDAEASREATPAAVVLLDPAQQEIPNPESSPLSKVVPLSRISSPESERKQNQRRNRLPQE